MEPVAAAGYVVSGYWTTARKRGRGFFTAGSSVYRTRYRLLVERVYRYESITLVQLSDSDSDQIGVLTWHGPFGPRELSNEISLAESRDVVGRVEAELGNIPDVAIRSETAPMAHRSSAAPPTG